MPSSFVFPEFVHDYEDFQPYISAETIDYHYGKHHRAYFDKLNGLIEGRPEYEECGNLEEIIMKSYKKDDAVFNNAAQVWNHTLYWSSMVKEGGVIKSKHVLVREHMMRDFGGVDKFKEEFIRLGMTQFGSGWVWLVLDKGSDGSNIKLKLMNGPNAYVPLVDGYTPLMVCDVWEHAYYIDYRNDRQKYLNDFLDYLINWNMVNDKLTNLSDDFV